MNTKTVDVTKKVIVPSASFGNDFFADIKDDPYRSYINRLAAYGVLNPADKFFPQNYFRVDDFQALLAKIYATALSKDILSMTSPDGFMTK